MEVAVTEYQKLQSCKFSTDFKHERPASLRSARLCARTAAFQTAVEARQQLDSQLRENEQVAKEFSRLTQNNEVYKLIGPVLVKQDQVEAKTNVDKRIEFIKGEMYVLHNHLPATISALTNFILWWRIQRARRGSDQGSQRKDRKEEDRGASCSATV